MLHSSDQSTYPLCVLVAGVCSDISVYEYLSPFCDLFRICLILEDIRRNLFPMFIVATCFSQGLVRPLLASRFDGIFNRVFPAGFDHTGIYLFTTFD